VDASPRIFDSDLLREAFISQAEVIRRLSFFVILAIYAKRKRIRSNAVIEARCRQHRASFYLSPPPPH
jgi:hypothetical protein